MLGALAQRVLQVTGQGLAKSVPKLPAVVAQKAPAHLSKHSVKLAGETITHGAQHAQGLFGNLLMPFTMVKTLFQKTFQLFRSVLNNLMALGQKLVQKS